MSGTYDCIVIGAGHNGLTAAGVLARAGRKVLVLEQRGVVGGLAAGDEFQPPYRSPGLLHDTSRIASEAVATLELDQHGLSFASERPAVFAPEREGRGLLLHGDAEKAAGEIARFSQKDADAYLAYRAFFDRIRDFINRLLRDLPTDVGALGSQQMWDLLKKGLALRRLGAKDMMELMRINLMCVVDWLNEWFETELLKALLAAPAVYRSFTGPWSPGNNLNLILWECASGRDVIGGPPALVDALKKAAASFGAEVRTGARVKKIRLRQGSVQGVTLDGGEEVNAALVLASCHPKHTFLDLIQNHRLPFHLEHAIQNYRSRGTTAKVNLALNAPLTFACRKDLSAVHVRTGDNLNVLERAFDPVKYGAFSETPLLEMFLPNSDPGTVPNGHHVLSILVHFVPYHLRAGWNETRREELGNAVLAVLERYAPGTGATVVAREVLTPADLESRYGLTEGHIHHGEEALDQMLVRPVTGCSDYATPFSGLYLCGSGSRPGGGLTCRPGLLAARFVQKSS